MDKVLITYDVELIINKYKGEFINTNISEADMKSVAKRVGMKSERIDKLVNHKNKRFNCYRAKGHVVYKTFHSEPVEPSSMQEQDDKRYAEVMAILKATPSFEK